MIPDHTTCPKCGRVSHNQNDILHDFCGVCGFYEDFTEQGLNPRTYLDKGMIRYPDNHPHVMLFRYVGYFLQVEGQRHHLSPSDLTNICTNLAGYFAGVQQTMGPVPDPEGWYDGLREVISRKAAETVEELTDAD